MVPAGVSHEVVRQTLVANGMTPATAAIFPGIEHELVRDALTAKLLGGTGGAAG